MKPIADVYRELAAKLWPWDKNRCGGCGYPWGKHGLKCTPQKCDCPPDDPDDPRADAPPDLASWSGVGQVVEAMLKKKHRVVLESGLFNWTEAEHRETWHCNFSAHGAECDTPWEAVARAALAALE